MMLSMMLRSKILKTKKRLSDTVWYLPCLMITLMGLFAVLAFGMRVTTITWNFGLIRAQIPVMHEPLADPVGTSAAATGQRPTMSEASPVLVMADDAFYLGDVAAFTKDWGGVRNKYKLPHAEGRPEMEKLIALLSNWQTERRAEKPAELPFLVLVPSDAWPAAVVMQVIHYLRKSRLYAEVILAGGLH